MALCKRQETASDWYEMSDVIGVNTPHVSWTIPEAEEREVAALGSAKGTAWFDMPSLRVHADEEPPARPEDRKGLPGAVSSVHRMVEELVASGLPSSRIVLGGFCQGGAVALVAALQCPYKLGGVASLSSWLPTCCPNPHRANKGIEVLLLHGQNDDQITPAAAEAPSTPTMVVEHIVD